MIKLGHVRNFNFTYNNNITLTYINRRSGHKKLETKKHIPLLI